MSAKEKYLESKYFYDAKGDILFQKIMACPEYYPTKCEFEIFTKKTNEIVSVFSAFDEDFDIVELGAGDATKSFYLLKELLLHKIHFTYFPVDISGNIIDQLQKKLPERLPSLKIKGLNGEYFGMLEKAKTLSTKIKVVLFLGGNIGNVPYDRAADFCMEMRQHLLPGDIVLTGFDLKKDPKTILDAYNDKAGYTRDFNLNLLERINKELNGNFSIADFYHFPTYNPMTGACTSFLVSGKKQQVMVADVAFDFEEGETIFTEIAQKYTVEQTDDLAKRSGFKPIKHFFNSKHWFLDAVWQCV